MYSPETQYQQVNNLQIRQQTHAKYTIGEPFEALVDTALQLEPNESLLDIGTANGAFPIRLHQAGHIGRLVGLDFSSGMITAAKAQDTNVEFLEGNAMQLPFPDSSFDVVTARHMLYHVHDIQKALEEVKRVLKPSGRFFACTNANGYLAAYWQVISETLSTNPIFTDFIAEHLQPKYFHGYLEQQIKNIFPSARLKIVDQHLEFTDAAAPLAYWHSMKSGFAILDADWQHGSDLLEAAFSKQTQQGTWRIWKGVAFFTANLATQ